VNGNAARVEFLLDDVRVQTVTAAPFQTRIDVGKVPRLHTIKAIAYDAGGKAIGEAVTTVNDRADAPHVSLISPVADEVSGTVAVEADAQVPAGRTLKSVELFWNDARLARFDKPPFRVDFEAPKSFGYFRAVATLDDGTTAEDARVVNAGGMSAEIDVHAIAFIATVVDRDGRHISGLTPADFVVRDEGKPVAATIRESPDEAVTIGLVIDASGSMKSSLVNVMEMATQFLDVTVTPKDKVFIVAFDAEPWVLHPPSSDIASLKKAVLSLRPGGMTATVDGVAFGLQQFSGMTGKRAIVVITDGREGASSQSAESAIHLAKDTGIPVYGIVTGGQQIGNPLVNIATATGGSMFFAPRKNDVVPMFEQIRGEVSGQYLISFVAQDRGKAGEWRKLAVEVAGKDAKVRTVSGYFAR
jgi:Ca-activated chloride channel homolog